MLYMFTLFIGMIGDQANGWGTSHLEPPENKPELTLRTSEVLSVKKFHTRAFWKISTGSKQMSGAIDPIIYTC